MIVMACLQRADDGPVFADRYLRIVNQYWEHWFFNVSAVSFGVDKVMHIVCVF